MVGFWGHGFRVRQGDFVFFPEKKKDEPGAAVDSR